VEAGFDVIGVDIACHSDRYRVARQACSQWAVDWPQWQENLSNWDEDTIVVVCNREGIDAIHASPPCQFGTALRHAPGSREHVNMIPHTRRLLEASGLPWVIENVDSDAVRPFMPGAIRLCGSMFGLGVESPSHKIDGPWGGVRNAFFQLRRHRLFCTNWPLTAPGPCKHTTPVVGVYGGHARNRSKAHGGRGTADFVGLGHSNVAGEAMGINWMTTAGLSEAIPPAYTRWIGKQLMEQIRCPKKRGIRVAPARRGLSSIPCLAWR
jgi:DNA (cytosine-5)-methyltransferase 1